ncbi:ABC-F family ATP-binding cassette domain-containing protein [Kineothrix alysoides]|nr:ABC-F family ATP-binding cassette domain-containing protein [Kineothrix alysoides]
MSLLEIEGLTHSFGDNSLYKNANLSLNKGEHLGIVGQNGAGKSTLIKICTEQVIPDAGRIIRHPNISMGYLDQYAKINGLTTVKDFLKSAFSRFYTIEEEMSMLYEKAACGNMECLSLAAKKQEQLEIHGFYSIDTKIDQVASGLGLLTIGLSRPIEQMSGGQQAKVILAKLLLEKPDVLLLDEPTNFLDKEHVEWLADYLSSLENAFMVVSHDYAFLDKIANRICDIDNNALSKYYGTYSEFLKKKTLLREDYIKQYTAQQKEIKKTEEFIQKNIAGRKSKMARGRRTQLERMNKMEALEQKEITPHFHFMELPSTNAEHLSAKNLSVGYHYPILSAINFSVTGGAKIAITGFNGIGKSTLLKTLVGQLPAMQGRYSFSEQVTIGYFEQDLIWPDETRTPMQIVSDTYSSLVVKEVRKHLARCGISSKHAMQPIATLSGGEQAKVKMCLLALAPCNFLIMDEPTNHLDIQAKEALKAALSEFSGTVLLVSHEEAFYKDLVQRVISIEKR